MRFKSHVSVNKEIWFFVPCAPPMIHKVLIVNRVPMVLKVQSLLIIDITDIKPGFGQIVHTLTVMKS